MTCSTIVFLVIVFSLILVIVRISLPLVTTRNLVSAKLTALNTSPRPSPHDDILADEQSLRQWAHRKNIKETVVLKNLSKELHQSCIGVLKPSPNWLLDVIPAQIHTKLRTPQRNVIFFSEPFVYMSKNYKYKIDKTVPRERYRFAREILWPIYEKYKKINICFCLTATMYQNTEGGYKSDANQKGWDPEFTSVENIIRATKDGVRATAKTYADHTITLKNMFTMPNYDASASNASKADIFERHKAHNYACHVYPMHLNAGQEWENPFDVPEATMARFKAAFKDETKKHHAQCRVLDDERIVEMINSTSGPKNANFWNAFMQKHDINVILFAGGQTHWLNRQLVTHGLTEYLNSSYARDMIISGWSAGIICVGASTALAAYKCHYHDLQYYNCDFIRDGEPKAGRGQYCLPIKYEIGIMRDKRGQIIKNDDGKPIHIDYSSQEQALEFCKLDGIGAYPGIVFPHVPNKADSNINILADVYSEISEYAFGVTANKHVVLGDDNNPYFGEVLALVDGECGAIGPLFYSDSKTARSDSPYFVRMPLDTDLKTNEEQDLSITTKSYERDEIRKWYAKVREVRRICNAQDANILRAARIIKKTKTS